MADPQEAARRLDRAVIQRAAEHARRTSGRVELLPTREQVSLVLRALADHTSITEALEHRPDPDSPWPHATSLGRWYHDVADAMEGGI
jgi:hypothetical protein